MKMIIDGKHVDAADGGVIKISSPITAEQIDTVPSATEQDVERALDAAVEGKEIWGRMPLLKRIEILMRVSDMLEAEKEQIATLLTREEGKVFPQSIAEAEEASQLFKGYAEVARHSYGTVLPPTNNDMALVEHEPLGVIACVVPFNFPVALYAHKVAPALAAGNAVIIKPASDTPLANIYMTDLLLRAGVPGKVAQIITGSGAVVGRIIANSPKINGISVTGSTEVGIDIATSAAKNLNRAFLELGGNDAMIVFEDANLELAAKEAIISRMINSGQVCCAMKRCIVHNSIKEEFAKMIVEQFGALKVGDPFDSGTDMGPLVNERAALVIEKQIALTVSQGARCILGGKKKAGSYFEPTVLVDVTADMDIAKDMEVFGPVIPIIGFDTEEEALRIANQSSYGLTGGVISGDMKRAVRVAKGLDTGTVVINGAGFYRTIDTPFGGHKKSGLGTEGFLETLQEMQKTKIMVWKEVYAD